MSVDDSGLETLKKAAEADPADQKAEYRYKTRVTESALPNGAATELTLQSLLVSVDQLEGYTDGIEGLLTSIRDNADQLEGFTDQLEGLITSSNGLLTTIRDNADTVETLLTAIGSNTDGVEGLITSSNTKLDTLHTDFGVVEGKQDTGNASLSSIDSKLTTLISQTDTLEATTDGIETLITSSNTKLDTLHSDTIVVEGKQDTGNTSLASVDLKLSTTNTQLAAINANTDGIEALVTSSNTKLDTLHTDLGVIEGKQDTGNTSLSSIDGKLTTTNTDIGGLTETAPGSDTASSGLNGRLQRVAQRLTSVFGALSDGTQKSQLVDSSGNIITSTTNTGLVSSKKPLDTCSISVCSGYYSLPLEIRQTAASASGATVWTMRNPSGSAKNVFIERIFAIVAFSGTKPVATSLLGYDICRFSTATPTGGTALSVIKRDNLDATSVVTDARFLDTGLTTTSVVFEGAAETIAIASTDGMSSTLTLDQIGLKLAAGEGLAFRLTTTAIIGLCLSGGVVWSER